LAGPLVTNTVATLTAKPGSGKTFLALDLALTVASGGEWLGEFEVQRGAVVYVVAEGGGGVGLRIRAWKQHHRVEGRAGVYFVMRAVTLLDTNEVSVFLAALRGLHEKPVLIVLDTLARCMVGADENSARDVGIVVAALDRIRVETGATVLALCHPPKRRGVGPRGSSALEGAADTMLGLEMKRPDQLTLTCAKQKDAVPSERIVMQLLPVPLGDAQTSCVVLPAGAPEPGGVAPSEALPQPATTALDALADLGDDGAGFGAWRDKTGQPETSFRRCISALTERGFIEHRGSGRDARYVITEEGRRYRHEGHDRQPTTTGGHGGEDQSPNRQPPPHPLGGGGDGGDGEDAVESVASAGESLNAPLPDSVGECR
jgi:hypothetical protein